VPGMPPVPLPGPPPVLGPTSLLQTVPRLLLGFAIGGTGIALMVTADLGLGPWDVLHQGVAFKLGIGIGIATILTGVVVLSLWFPLRERPGLGTVMNVLTIGLVVDLVLSFLTTPDALWQRWALLIVSVPMFALGTSTYLGVGLGSGPRDGIMTALARRGVPIGVARTGIELTALVVGYSLGGTVGVGTIYFALGIGPMVHVMLPRCRAPWFPPGTAPRVLGSSIR
jgi:uncharacterized membrane protein YczE